MNLVQLTCSLDVFWHELIFIEACLEANPRTRHLAPQIADLLTQYETLALAERELQRKVTLNRARVKIAESTIEEHVRDAYLMLLYKVKNNKKDRRYEALWDMHLSTFLRLNPTELQTKLLKMKSTLMLEIYEDAFRDAQNDLLDLALLEVKGIQDRQGEEKEHRMLHRADVEQWKNEANQVRLNIYAHLLQLSPTRGTSWARNFFPTTKRGKKLTDVEKAEKELARAQKKSAKTAAQYKKQQELLQKAQDKVTRESARARLDGRSTSDTDTETDTNTETEQQ